MSAILTILGRATRDPEMQQGKNSGTEYVSLDIAVSQRGQDGKEETIYYQCYFNKFLAERLAKAGVKKGTGLMIYGDLELHPFIYQKGKNAGQANAGPRINVKDWHFVPSNRSDSNTGHPGANQNSQPNGGAATPGAAGNGSYPMQGNPNGSYQNQAMPGGYPQQGMAPANGAYTPPANGGQYQAPPNGTGQPQSSYPPQGSYTGMPNYGGMPGSQPTDGFQMCRNRWHPSCPINSQGTLCLGIAFIIFVMMQFLFFMSESGDFPSSFRACLRIMNQKGISS